MKNEISTSKRLLFIGMTLVLAFMLGYLLFTGGVLG